MSRLTINQFSGPYAFLSNFHGSYVFFGGKKYPTVEHAFQAAKTLDRQEREEIRLAAKPGQAKKLGRAVVMRADWEDIKVDLMFFLLLQKFARPRFHRLLRETGAAELIEGNTWHDTFWGECVCARHAMTGRNELGKCLMEIRRGIVGKVY